MKYFLCGQTGNINRGCEAIVRSTVKILNQRNGDIYFATFAPDQDRTMSRELGITMISYAEYPSSLHRYYYAGVRKIFKKSLAGLEMIERPLFSRIETGDVCLTIGGDTYCYGRPINSLALNKFTSKKKIKNILWCCSIEKGAIKGEIFRDLNQYEYIFAREVITYQNLLEAGISKEKVIKCCDPAFFLNKKAVPFPENFIAGNTVGLNVSEMVINESNPCVYENIMHLISYILNETDMSICLIPHVYSIKNNSNDYPILKKICNEVNSRRVCMVNKEYDCEQLKYIISNCRFFVGARTHSTIAAYSTGVPTLVLGYSVKSKGIAKDLFGTYTDYVLPYDELVETETLKNTFVKLVGRENEIKKRYEEFLPGYKKTLLDAVNKYVISKESEGKVFNICDVKQCAGCFACVDICPRHCISIEQNEEGFEYPTIDYMKCVNCGLCRRKCPVANKPKDDNSLPNTMMAIHKDNDVRMNSSSGGIFTAIAEYVIEQNGIVYGAGYDSEVNVVHKSCVNKEDLAELRGSKYVQSRIHGIYPEIKKQLNSGKMVLFTGTPCQIGGLYAYLGKDYERLYTLDFVCHGVPSPFIWKKYISYREKVANSKVKKVLFRSKETGWKNYSVVFEFENGKKYSQMLTKDLYMRGYLADIFMRPSCSECSFKQVHRQSDITVSDFWGIEKVIPEMNDDKGVSVLMVHSVKGERILESIKEQLISKTIDFEAAMNENRSYYVSIKQNAMHSAFFLDARNLEMDKLIEKYCGSNLESKIRRKMAQYFPKL